MSALQMNVLRRTLLIACAALVLLPTGANAASLHLIFPQSVDVTVVQGQSTPVSLEVQAYGAIACSATTASVRIAELYSVDAVGDIAAGLATDMPITTDKKRGTSDNCYIHTPVAVPLTATAASETPVGDYTSVVRYGKGGDGGVDLDGPPITIHVIAPEVESAPELPAPTLEAPPEILVLGERAVAPHPTLGKTLLLTRVKGKVFFRMPGKVSTTLGNAMVVPNGTVIDATKGVVKVTVARDSTNARDSADAWGTTFKAAQDAPSTGKATTTFTLTGDIAAPSKAARAARAAKKSRSLWVNGKGNFKTKAKRASAIVRGTYWVTTETASGSRVSVKRGLVAVRDFVQHKTVLVSAGHSYTATPKTHTARRIPAFTGSTKR
jgi:hypothetical protein